MDGEQGELVVLSTPPTLSHEALNPPRSRAGVYPGRQTTSAKSGAIYIVDDSEDDSDDCLIVGDDSVRKQKQPKRRRKTPRGTLDLTSETPDTSYSRSQTSVVGTGTGTGTDEVVLIESGSGGREQRRRSAQKRRLQMGSQSKQTYARNAGKRSAYSGYQYQYQHPYGNVSTVEYGGRASSSSSSAGVPYNGKRRFDYADYSSGYNRYQYYQTHQTQPQQHHLRNGASRGGARFDLGAAQARSLRGPSKAKLRALLSSGRDFTAEDYETLLQLDESTQKKGLSKAEIDSACATTYLKTIPKDAACSICLSPFTTKQKIAILGKCTHKFHYRCSARWLRQKNMCPICQHKVL